MGRIEILRIKFAYLKINVTACPKHPHLWIITHLCLTDAIHNFKWGEIIQIWQNGGQRFGNPVDWGHVLVYTCSKTGI